MLKVLGLRLLGAIPVLLALALAVFILQQVAPVDPAVALVGEKAPREVLERAREELGLNDPIPVQYVNYVGDLVQGDLGESSVTRRPVRTDLTTFLPATMELVLVTFAMIIVFGTFLGVATAQGWRGSGILRLVMVGGSSVPVFLAALLGMILFYRQLGWLPATGRTSIIDAPEGPTNLMMVDGLLRGRLDVVWDTWRHLVLPAGCMALGPAVTVGRVLRSSLTHTLRSDYVRTARAKGLRERRVLAKHALRNSVGPALALGGVTLASLFGTTILVEVIFAYPGVGLYISQAIGKGDFNTIAGVTVVLGVLYVFLNTVVDLLQAAADPRIRF
jgi:peptide/nickel transport system permease protein